MSREFVRNIKNTVLKGKNKEPLHTNIQNDLLSDKEDVYVRNQKEYHCLTDNIKEIVSPNIKINKINKNKVELISMGEGGEGVDLSDYAKKEDVTKEIQESLPPEVKLLSTNDKLTIEKNGVNDFTLTLSIDDKEIDLSNYYTKDEINKMIESLNTINIISLSDLLTIGKEGNDFTLDLDLSDYATKEDVDNKIKEIPVPETKISSISNRLLVDEKSLNNFELALNLEGLATSEEIINLEGIKNVVSADVDVIKIVKTGDTVTITPDLQEFVRKSDILRETSRYRFIKISAGTSIDKLDNNDVIYLFNELGTPSNGFNIRLTKPMPTGNTYLTAKIYLLRTVKDPTTINFVAGISGMSVKLADGLNENMVIQPNVLYEFEVVINSHVKFNNTNGYYFIKLLSSTNMQTDELLLEEETQEETQEETTEE